MAIYTPPAAVEPRFFMPCPSNDETLLEPGMAGIKSGDGNNEMWYKPFKNLVSDPDTTPILLLSAAVLPQNEEATVDPTPDDDSGDGFSRFSMWANINTGDIFICSNATAGSAVWDGINKFTLDDVVKNGNLLSRTMDVSSGHVTGINASALKNDAINRQALQRATMPLLPVISELATLPASPDPGDRHLLSSAATTHAGEIAQAVPDVLDYTTWAASDTTGFDYSYRNCIRIPEWNMWMQVGVNGVSYSTDNCKTFHSSSVPAGTFYAIAFAPEINTVCIVGSSGVVATSKDGSTFTAQTGSNTNNHRGICWASGMGSNEGRFLVTSGTGTGNRAMYSDYGTSWADAATPSDLSYYGVDFSVEQGKAFSVATSGARGMTTTDGESWNSAVGLSVPNGAPFDVEWCSGFNGGNGVWVIVSSSADGIVSFSYDLTSWSVVNVGLSLPLYALSYAKSISSGLIAICTYGTSGGNKILTTADLVSFSEQTIPADNPMYDICWGNDLGNFLTVSDTGTANRIMTSAVDTRWMYEPPQNGNSVYVQSLDAYYEHIDNTWIQPTNRPVLTDYGKANMRAVYVAETNTTDTGTDSATMTMVTGNADFLEAFDLNKAYLLDVELMVMMLDTSYTAATTIWHGKALRAPYTGDSPTFANLLTNNDAGYGATVFNVDPVFVWGSSGLEATVEHTGEASRTYDAAWQLLVRLQYLDDGEPVC